jgi:paraquat-inducible protein B
MIKVFVNAPYHEKVRQNTRFWNASGIDLTMNANGIKLDTQSLISIMTGGVSFGLRQNDLPGNPAEEDAQFQLYPNQSSSEKDIYTVKEYYMMYFDQSVRGLTIGAPIEIKGIQAGEVVSVDLRFDKRKLDFVIPVLVVLEPERLSALVTEEGTVITGKTKEEEIAKRSEENAPKRVQALIDKGFRAQLKTGSLLTGQLYIDLDFYPDAPPAKLAMEGGYPVFPTIPAPLEQIVERVNNILEKFEKMPLDQIVQRVDNLLEKFEKMPLEEIGQELNEAIAALTLTLKDIKMMSGNINGETLPKVNAALENLQGALKGIESTLGADSALNYNIRMITDELSTTLRSVRSLMDYLEREPQSLIFGKEGENP